MGDPASIYPGVYDAVMGDVYTSSFFTTLKWSSVSVILPSFVGMVHIRIVKKRSPGM